MKITASRSSSLWRIALPLFALAQPLMHGQETLRDSLASARASEARQRALENQRYNLEMGPVRFAFGASLQTEFNDNVNYGSGQDQDDIIFRPQFQTLAYWPVTDANALYFSMGLGYVKYLENDQFDYFLVSPGSTLSFDLFVKDFRFTFYDAFSYSLDPLTDGSVSGTARHGGFQNTAGANALWDLNELILTTGYSHFNFVSGTSEFEHENRSAERFLVRATFLPEANITFGIEGTAAVTSYEQNILNDSTSYSGGAFAEWQLTRHMELGVRGGYAGYSFDSTGTAGPARNLEAYYFTASLDHRINERLSHALSAGREVRAGSYSDYVEEFSVRHSATWNIIRDLGLSSQLFYEHGQYSDATYFFSGGERVLIPGQKYDRYGFGIHLSYQLMEKLSASLGYRHTVKSSDTTVLDYRQNAIILNLTYSF